LWFDAQVRRRGSMATGIALVLLLTACGPSPAPAISAAGNPPQEGLLDRTEAERHVLAMVNRDRAAYGLPALVWDEAAARAGRRHAEDMAAHGFTAHVGTDGSVPEQRFTEAGGEDAAFENVGCFVDGDALALDPEPRIALAELEQYERMFLDERPPFDGHRQNILTPWHTALGVGLAQIQGGATPCMVQEFVNDHGTYTSLPRKLEAGGYLEIRGELREPAELSAVGLARIDPPRPHVAAELNRTGAYLVPAPYLALAPRPARPPYFPRPYGVLELQGNRFGLGIKLDDGGRAGRYEVSVWARLPSAPEPVLISLRAIEVARRVERRD
jgi:hypothetical protein